MQPCGWRTAHGAVLGVCWGLWPIRPDGPSEKTQWPEELQGREEWIHKETEVVAEKLPEMTHWALAGKELGNISTSVFLFMCVSTSSYKNPTLQNREHFQLLKMDVMVDQNHISYRQAGLVSRVFRASLCFSYNDTAVSKQKLIF